MVDQNFLDELYQLEEECTPLVSKDVKKKPPKNDKDDKIEKPKTQG